MSFDYLREGFRATAAADAAQADPRHDDADTMPVAIERSDAIDAVAGLAMLAANCRRQAKSRSNAGAFHASTRKWLRESADVYDAAAKRVQRAADDATR